jgi:hypothetical protein
MRWGTARFDWEGGVREMYKLIVHAACARNWCRFVIKSVFNRFAASSSLFLRADVTIRRTVLVAGCNAVRSWSGRAA